MQTMAVVPVKGLAGAKRRLGAVLTPDERAALMLQTFHKVLGALDAPGIAGRLVVSPDERVLRAATLAGATPLAQVGGGLNAALDQARTRAAVDGAEALLIVLGDLPLLGQDDIAGMLALAGVSPAVVLAPDRHGAGTNAMVLRPPDALPFAFGAGSLARHHAATLARGLPLHLYHGPGTALDLDTPADLAALRARVAARSGMG